MAKADKYQHKRYERRLLLFQRCLIYSREINATSVLFFHFHDSEVRVYDPSGDSTIPSTSKKRKFEEMEEEEEAAEPVTPVVKSKKSKKEAAAAVEVEGEQQQMTMVENHKLLT